MCICSILGRRDRYSISIQRPLQRFTFQWEGLCVFQVALHTQHCLIFRSDSTWVALSLWTQLMRKSGNSWLSSLHHGDHVIPLPTCYSYKVMVKILKDSLVPGFSSLFVQKRLATSAGSNVVYCNSWHFTPCENCATPKGSMLWQDKEGFQRLHRFLAAISL